MAWMLIKRLSERQYNTTSINGTWENAGEYSLVTQRVSRFPDDHIFKIEEETGVILDGVILNKTELLQTNPNTPWPEMILEMEAPVCASLRGPFTGCLWKDDNLYAFANQTGDTAIFYYRDEEAFVVSSDFNLIFHLCSENDLPLTYDTSAAQHILSFGWIVEGHTLANEIHRLPPGDVLYFEQNLLQERPYYRIDNTHPLEVSMSEAIELLDCGFRKAVKRCFDKDLEYGYTHHLADMSGGLDSRMTNWVARNMGYSNITNICYAKAASLDAACARAASLKLGNEFIFKHLDDLTFFKDVDDVVLKNYGCTDYIAFTGGNRILGDINFEKFGLEHTGQIGDVVIGSFIGRGQPLDVNPAIITSSVSVKADINSYNEFLNQEQFALYYRAFYGVLSSHFIRQNYTIAVSPFLDTEFLSLCMSIPLELRCNHRLYLAWIKNKYPEALSVQTTRATSENQHLTWRDIARKMAGKNKKAVRVLLVKLKLYKLINETKSMNPLDYWYYSDADVREFLSSYFEENIYRTDKYMGLREQVENSWKNERFVEKALSITILGGLKNYFGREQ